MALLALTTHPSTPHRHRPQHDQSVTSVGARINGDLNLGQLEDWISDLLKTKGTQLFRYKGVLAVKGYDTKWIFQVGGSERERACMHA